MEAAPVLMRPETSLFPVAIKFSSSSMAGPCQSGHLTISSLSWIYDGRLLMTYSTGGTRINKIGVWAYPKGGQRKDVLKFQNSQFWVFQGSTISVASMN